MHLLDAEAAKVWEAIVNWRKTSTLGRSTKVTTGVVGCMKDAGLSTGERSMRADSKTTGSSAARATHDGPEVETSGYGVVWTVKEKVE